MSPVDLGVDEMTNSDLNGDSDNRVLLLGEFVRESRFLEMDGEGKGEEREGAEWTNGDLDLEGSGWEVACLAGLWVAGRDSWVGREGRAGENGYGCEVVPDVVVVIVVVVVFPACESVGMISIINTFSPE
jgi:hypothetical protein